jgi:hypothetical protein
MGVATTLCGRNGLIPQFLPPFRFNADTAKFLNYFFSFFDFARTHALVPSRSNGAG